MTDSTRNPPMGGPLILPVGRYTGEFHPAVGAPVQYHSLSIGRRSVTLEDPQAFAVWAAAHPRVDRPDATWDRPDATWDRTAVSDAARRLGVADPDRVVAEFLTDGLLVEIAADAPDVVDFARAYRVLPLMVSLGNTPDDPLRYGIGLFGTAPVLRLPASVHDVWQWSSAHASLWDVCQVFADAGARAGVADTREHDPRHVLREFLAALPRLVGANAACLDEARW